MRRAAASVAIALAVVGGCDRQETPYVSLEDRLESMFGAVSLSPPLYQSVVEAGPLTQFRDGALRVEANADAIVVGNVTTVQPGRSFSWPDGPQVVGGPDTQVEHRFNADDAMLSTVHVTVEVTDGVTATGETLAGTTITFGLSLPSPVAVDGLEKELQGFGDVAVLLINNPRSFFTYDPSVYGVLQYGAFLAPVVNDTVTFPLSGLENESARVADLLQNPVVVPLTRDEAGEYQRDEAIVVSSDA